MCSGAGWLTSAPMIIVRSCRSHSRYWFTHSYYFRYAPGLKHWVETEKFRLLLPVDREAWSPWSGRVYLLKAGWPGVLGQHVVDSTQLGVYLQAEVTHNLHTNLLSPYCNFHYLKKYTNNALLQLL